MAGDKVDDLLRQIWRRLDRKHGAVQSQSMEPSISSSPLPAMQDQRIGAVEKRLSRDLKILHLGVKYGEVEVWADELNNAIGLEQGIFRLRQMPANGRNRICQPTLLGAYPKHPFGSGAKKARGVAAAGWFVFFRNGPAVVGRGALANLSIQRTPSVPELGDLERRPAMRRQSF